MNLFHDGDLFVLGFGGIVNGFDQKFFQHTGVNPVVME
jgi:hypothetical protein